MPFADFVKTTVLLAAAAATTLAVATLLSARAADDPQTATIAAESPCVRARARERANRADTGPGDPRAGLGGG